ncbi:protein kinase domain-containing protein [Sorangium sp. So ce1335]|uniref:serine/threonine-protein kinase n=1 Tax=Sorangium sp. So ce1335 TaxID=3133335 RepID=UPI003F5E2B16
MSATLAEGTVFARRYRVVRLIATGGMGSIHEVVHLETARRRALKAMHAHIFEDEEMRERFKLEARIAANVESEYIVEVFDAGVDEATGTPFLVMELLRGEDLGKRLKRAGRLPPAEVVTYLHQTALALDRTHAAAIVHRDLKPANIFLSEREDGSIRVKLLDFGIAKLIADGTAAAGATRNLGTPIYMAPEQFQVGARLTGAADIYALGMIAYALLVGTPYWRQEARSAGDMVAFALLAARGPQEPPVPRAHAQGVMLPPGFDAWFARATAVDPAARFGRAVEAVQALGEVLGLPVGVDRWTIPGAPSWPGVVPAATTTAPAHEMAAPGTIPYPERDSRSPGLPLARTQTEAAVSARSTSAAKPVRGPFAAGLAVLGLGVLGAGSWLLLGAHGGGHPAVAAPGTVSESPAAPGPTAAAPGLAAAAPGAVTAPPGQVTAPPGQVTAPPGQVTAPPGPVTAPPGSVTAPPGPVTAPGPAVPPDAAAAAAAPLRPSAHPPAPTSTPAPSRPRPPSASSASKKPPPRKPDSTSDLYGRH